MIVTIDNESRSRIKLSVDLDFSADRFKTSNLLFTFPAPVLETIDKNLFFLLKNSKQKDLDKKYNYRPDYLSYDEYGTVVLAHFLMYVNGVFSLEDFINLKIVIPSKSAIMDILKDKFPERSVDELSEVNW